MRRLFISFSLFAVVLGWATWALGERRLSLSDAVKLALKQNTQLKLEQAKVEEADATRKSARGHYGPKVVVDGNLMVWDSALPFEFEMPDPADLDMEALAKKAGVTPIQLATTFTKYADLFTVMPVLFDLGDIRDQVTAQLSVTLAQPITPLLQVHSGHKAAARVADAARQDQKSKETEVAHQVSATYFRLMQAQRFAEVAQTGVDQVEAHLKRARHFHTAGLIGKQDVLKAQLELARAKERVIKARTGVSLARSGLALLLGLSLDEKLVPTEKVEDPPRAFGLDLRRCVERALDQRSELKAMKRRREAAEAGHARAKWDLIPQLSAVATYQHTRGQGTFFPENAFFAGGVLKWELWDWGGKYYAMKAANKKTRQAELGLRLLRDGIQLQTKKAYLELNQSREALAVARAAIVEAEENYRIETKRFEANANTSTDVLDAQLALTRAKLSYTTALYGYYIARAALMRAMGQAG
jgi:outer membrane protein TolC